MAYLNISKEKGIEIIVLNLNKSDYYYTKIEKLLLDTGRIDDCVPYKEFIEKIETADNASLEKMLEIL